MTPTLQSWAQILALGAIMVGALVYQTRYIDKVIEGLRNEINERFRTVEERLNGLRAELKAEIAGLRAELKAEIAGLRAELKAEIVGLRGEMNQRFNNTETRLDRIEHPLVRG